MSFDWLRRRYRRRTAFYLNFLILNTCKMILRAFVYKHIVIVNAVQVFPIWCQSDVIKEVCHSYFRLFVRYSESSGCINVLPLNVFLLTLYVSVNNIIIFIVTSNIKYINDNNLLPKIQLLYLKNNYQLSTYTSSVKSLSLWKRTS